MSNTNVDPDILYVTMNLAPTFKPALGQEILVSFDNKEKMQLTVNKHFEAIVLNCRELRKYDSEENAKKMKIMIIIFIVVIVIFISLCGYLFSLRTKTR